MSAPQLTVTWLDRDNAHIALPTGEAFNAARTGDGWSTRGSSSIDGWSFTRFEDLLTFVQDRAR